ncbi:MAG TPA: sensor histidine kinase [Pilimelia sp.]|nr:sensor histidine kinase [Pilimelia sp.]
MQRLHRWLREHPRLFDALAAAVTVLLAFPFALAWLYAGTAATGTAALGAGALSLAFAAPLWVRSRHPVGALYATAALGAVGIVTLPVPVPAGLFAAMVMAYSAAAYAPRPHARAALALAVLGGVASGLGWLDLIGNWLGRPLTVDLLARYLRDPLGAAPALTASVVATAGAVLSCTGPLVGAWLWGSIVRARQALFQEALDRAERLERERDALARVAVVEERNRIAREMHDIVAHGLSVVILQADGARLMVRRDPGRAEQALDRIGETGREAITEVRRLIGVLRTPGDGATGDGVGPQPVLERLPELVEQLAALGLPVRLDTRGQPGPVPPGVALSAYRIVQEALTNALRHGGPGVSAHVRLTYAGDRLLVEVTDDGRGAAAPDDGAGHGLLGMRERAAAVGGRLRAGPRPGGGFAVTAELPYAGAVPAGAVPGGAAR